MKVNTVKVSVIKTNLARFNLKLLRLMPIRYKILSIAFVAIIGLSVYILQNYQVSSDNSERLSAVQDTYFPILEKIDLNLTRLEQFKDVLSSAVIMEDEDGIEEADEISTSILVSFKQLSELGDRARVNDLQQMFVDYRQSALALAQAMIESTLTRDAQSKTMKDVAATALLLNTELKKFRDISYQNFTQAIAESKQAAADAVVVGVLIGLCVSIVLLLTSWGISRSII